MYAALVLLGITLVVNMIGAFILQRASPGMRRSERTGDNREQLAASHADAHRSLCRRRFRRTGAIAAPSAHAHQFPAERAGRGMTLLALIPLFSVVWMLVWRGGKKLSLALFTQLPPAPLEQGGGFGNAIVGTLIMVASGGADQRAARRPERPSILAQAPDSNRLAERRPVCRQGADRISLDSGRRVRLRRDGAGTGGYSAIAGAVALSILMLPTIMLTAEDAIRMVPAKMKEAAIGMGATNNSDRHGWCCCPPPFPGF